MSSHPPHELLAHAASGAAIPFNFEGMEVRAILDQDGEPWFVAKDVSEVLGYSDSFEMSKKLDDDEKQNRQIAGFGPRGITVISEAGLYSSILTSYKPEAKRFKRWVTHDVLPAIRKTGQYAAPARAELSRLELLEMAMASERERIASDTKVQHLEHRLADQAPAVAAFDLIANAKGTNKLSVAAKLLQMKPCELIEYLLRNKWMFREKSRSGNSWFIAYQDRLDAKYLEHKFGTYPDPHTGERKVKEQVLVTRKGVARLAELLAAEAVAHRVEAAGQRHQQLRLPEG